MSHTTPGDLSPRAGAGDEGAADPQSPSSESAVLGLPREVSLAELFPAEAAMGAPSPGVLDNGDLAAGPGSESESGSGAGPGSRTPLVAGAIVMLAILFGGGGFLRWRSRDSAYWPA